ncbi:hypothetical protein [Burkholderia cepacia]|uniref:hypothetical protein n=1 Tax=Burkholderia cepacia TaxID=292 RepID=UPI001CE4ABA5|nr:hypothetical protein [Burkholderia cepacia]
MREDLHSPELRALFWRVMSHPPDAQVDRADRPSSMLMAFVEHYVKIKVDFSCPHFANYKHAKPLAELKATLSPFDIDLPMAF